MNRRPKKGWTGVKKWRKRFMAAHNYCHWCGCKLRRDNATIDHLVPKSKGGSNRKANLRLSCSNCNNRRGNSATVIPELCRNGVVR